MTELLKDRPVLDAAENDTTTPGLAVQSMTPPRRKYVVDHLERAGWIVDGLGDDQFLTIFRLLSRVEEFETTTRHNRHNWELLFAPIERRDQAMIPILERQLVAWENQGLLRCRKSDSRWPAGRPFCVCLTHDVDQLQEYLWLERWRSLRHQQDAPGREKLLTIASFLKESARRIVTGGRRATPDLEQWLEVEERHGFKSTFMFFGVPVPRPCWEDAFYRYSDHIDFGGLRITIGEAMRRLADTGWDVGLHGSCESHTNATSLRAEREAVEEVIGAPITSTRQHHLLCDVRITPRVHAEAGLLTDSTFGSNVNTEFRCGTCLPFFMYDLVRDEPLPVLQVPLVIQDGPLAENLARDEELMVHRCVELMDRVEEVGGVLTLLWHNQHRSDTAEFRCYSRVLAEAARRDAWGCSMKQLDDWWRNREGTA